MYFRFPEVSRWLLSGAAIFLTVPFCFAQPHQLKVCADPNDLPFSNAKQQGFENRIATLIAADLHEDLVYRWQRLDRGGVREYLNQSLCDLLTGIPNRSVQVLTTEPYYRSTYVFVYRRDARSKPSSLDDAALHSMKIAVQAVGEEYTPPGDALAQRGLQAAIVPFHTNGGDEDELLDAVAARRVDTAIVWGPAAGYFARFKHQHVLELIPITPQRDTTGVPFTFAISMAVRRGNADLLRRIDDALHRHADEIHNILASYGIPQLQLAVELRTAQ
jgi:mxaJ protein